MKHFFKTIRHVGLTKIMSFIAVAGLAACSGPWPGGFVNKWKSKEYFSEKEYGVKASPRVSAKHGGLRRGGGRYQVGKPYKIRGKWYYPKEVRSYSKVGNASWYGAAFHGRLTANGEVYDMTHLTAAHPTLPLPSYARVTNLKNGGSVVVRVNDRGPFARGRIIDLSKRAAELLDYTHSGVAKVKVDYIGRAPLHGKDDSYLVASYRRNGASSPSDGLPAGVLIAMNGSGSKTARKLPPNIIRPDAGLPETGPILPDRPGNAVLARLEHRLRPLAYAGDRKPDDATIALDRFAKRAMAADDIISSWKRQRWGNPEGRDTIFAGTFADRSVVGTLTLMLGKFGSIETQRSEAGAEPMVSIMIHSGRNVSSDQVLRHAWKSGAPNAMVLRD